MLLSHSTSAGAVGNSRAASANSDQTGSATRLLHQLHGWPQAAERPNERVDTYALEVAAFLDLIRDGAPNPAPYEQAARTLQLILAAYRAAEARRTVPLPEDPTRLD